MSARDPDLLSSWPIEGFTRPFLSWLFENSHIGVAEAIAIALNRLKAGLITDPQEEQIALALGDPTGLGLAERLLRNQEFSEEFLRLADSIWLYLEVVALRRAWDDIARPWDELSVVLMASGPEAGYERFVFFHPRSGSREDPWEPTARLRELDEFLPEVRRNLLARLVAVSGGPAGT